MRLQGLFTGLALIAACMPALQAGQPEPPRRPRIGVAFGGGSALGLSHVGVLKWFEENRIPVDFVAGTSMGGLVGGLYATGHSAAEMQEFVRRIDWDSVLMLTPAFPNLTYRRKEDRRDFPNQLEIGLRGGLHGPPGLSTGHGVGLVLSRFTSPYGHMASFDQLPIPFRCVATDLLSGEQVVFKDGSLFDALRSTMSLPGVFMPWKSEGRTVVDGGTLNNVPADVVRAMGADIVIAVVLENPPRQEKDVQGVLGVAGQSISVMIGANEKQGVGLADIVLRPKLDGFKSTDYQRGDELRQVGYEAAAVARAQLEKLSIPQDAWASHLENRKQRRRSERIKPEFVKVTGTTDANRAVVEREFSGLIGKDLDQRELETGLDHISGLGRYATAHSTFIEESGRQGLEVHVREKGYSPPKLDTGLLVDAANGQSVRFGVGGRLTFLDFGGAGSEWRTDMSLGGINLLGTEYYWRVKGSRFFVAPRGFYSETNLASYSSGTRTAEYGATQKGFGADIGIGGGRFSELRVGVEMSNLQTSLTTGSVPEPELEGNYRLARARWAYEGQDSGLIPRRGLRTVLESQWVFDSPSGVKAYPVFMGGAGWAKPFNDKWSFLSYGSAGSRSHRAEVYPAFTLGGSGRMSSLGRNQLVGSRQYFGSVAVLRTLGKPSLLGRFYGATAYEIGNAWYKSQSAKPYHSGTIGIAAETVVGIVYVGFSVGDKGERKIFFRLGRIY